jgi:hypothetical protein
VRMVGAVVRSTDGTYDMADGAIAEVAGRRS